MEEYLPAGDFSKRSNAPKAAAPVVARLPQLPSVGNLKQASSDEEFERLMKEAAAQKRPVVVNYGAPWCHACKKMLPTFLNLSSEYTNPLFIYAEVEKCSKATKDIQYTPTFQFYREDGKKVDEFYGAGQQRLRDRVWMQS